MTQIFPPAASARAVTLPDLLVCVQVKQMRSHMAKRPHLTSLEMQGPSRAGQMGRGRRIPSQRWYSLGSQPIAKKTQLGFWLKGQQSWRLRVQLRVLLVLELEAKWQRRGGRGVCSMRASRGFWGDDDLVRPPAREKPTEL